VRSSGSRRGSVRLSRGGAQVVGDRRSHASPSAWNHVRLRSMPTGSAATAANMAASRPGRRHATNSATGRTVSHEPGRPVASRAASVRAGRSRGERCESDRHAAHPIGLGREHATGPRRARSRRPGAPASDARARAPCHP
jgi:hypothetical protein